MAKKKTLAQEMRSRGIVLSVWAEAKGMSKKDKNILWQISQGLIKGAWGRAKELKEELEKDGIKVGGKE